jgi:hypothetical protein
MLARRALLLLVPLLILAAYESVRLAWAGYLARSSDPAVIALAATLAPGDAAIQIKLADAREAMGADPTPALQAAAALDPENATVWMRLGLAAEMRGDIRTAENRLLEAARASRQFAPRWTLANFYLRRGDQAHFWPWVKASLLMSYGDLNPVFQLCWNMSQDPATVLERAIPPRRSVLNPYLSFLLQQNRLAAAGPVASKLAALALPEDQPVLIAWCNGEIETGVIPPALEVWNILCSRRLLPYTPLDAARLSLTDGTFTTEPLGGGFAWRKPSVPGIVSGLNASPRYLWFSFDGKQPESCEPLEQYAPVLQGSSYKLSFEYRTADVPAVSGLQWRVLDPRSGAALAVSPPLSSNGWTKSEVQFNAPPDMNLARLVLAYRRSPGTTRIEGLVSLRAVSLERLP